jgi:superfamily II helicase
VTTPEDIPQTLVYLNFCIEVEDMQDVIQAHLEREYSMITPDCVEFYHQHIGSKRKKIIEDKIHSGLLQIVFTTDALGSVSISSLHERYSCSLVAHQGMNFLGIKRVWIWMMPATFNSLVQKYGCCVQLLHKLGEGVLLVTCAYYDKYCKAEEAKHAFDLSDSDSDGGLLMDEVMAAEMDDRGWHRGMMMQGWRLRLNLMCC